MGTANVNSIMNKLGYINDLLFSNNLSVLVICETWLTAACPSSYVSLPGFVFFRGDVLGSVKKHGVGIYVRESLTVVPVEVDLPNLVIVFVVQWSLYVVALYRPPSYSGESPSWMLKLCCTVHR